MKSRRLKQFWGFVYIHLVNNCRPRPFSDFEIRCLEFCCPCIVQIKVYFGSEAVISVVCLDPGSFLIYKGLNMFKRLK